VGGEHLVHVGGDLGQHRQEGHARPNGRRRERSGTSGHGEGGDGREVAEPQRRAPRRADGRPGHLSDRFQREAVGHARPHLAPDDTREDLALARGRAGQELSEKVLLGLASARALSLSDRGKRAGDVAKAERRAGSQFIDGRQPADPKRPRVRWRKRPARQERDGGGDVRGRQRPEELRDEAELLKPRGSLLELVAEGHEAGEVSHIADFTGRQALVDFGRATSSCEKQSDGAPSDDRGQRQDDPDDLAKQTRPLHVLSGARQKKGARAATVYQRVGERAGAHTTFLSNPQKPRSSPMTLPRIRTCRSRGSTTMGFIVRFSGLSTMWAPSRR